MWAMNSKDRAELEAYRALGTVEQIKARLEGPYPDDEGLAPLPYSDHDPAQAAAEGYGDAWQDEPLYRDEWSAAAGLVEGEP